MHMHHWWTVVAQMPDADRNGWLFVAQSLIGVCMPCGLSAAYVGVMATLIVKFSALVTQLPHGGTSHIFHNPVQHQGDNISRSSIQFYN